jgi:hypothetical protein
MAKALSPLSLVLCLFATAWAQPIAKDFLPAGTLLHCTLDEPNFSAKTAQPGDPVLCSLSTVASFGHPVFPRGAYLTGQLQDFAKPGRFVGKGWIEITFDRLVLPGPQIFPLTAKVSSAPRYKVDSEGKIHGQGHAGRDIAEWMIPPLWPVKIITLPLRGPFPAMKGEERLTLRLMEDVEVPAVASNFVPMPPWASPSRESYEPASNSTPQLTQRPVLQTAALSSAQSPETTLLVRKDGDAELASDYWLEGERLHYITQNAVEKMLSLEALNLTETVRINRERNVDFVLRSRDVPQQQ